MPARRQTKEASEMGDRRRSIEREQKIKGEKRK
jgi:hypothetical protein